MSLRSPCRIAACLPATTLPSATRISAAEAGVAYPECDAWNEAVVRSLDQEAPDVVVTSGVARSAWAGEATDRGLLVQGYSDRWRWLTDRGVPVVVVGDSPLSPDDLDICAARNPRELGRCTFEAQPAVAGSGLPVEGNETRWNRRCC